MSQQNVFERFPKSTLLIALIFLALIGCVCAEYFARAFGLGNVLIYDSHPIYGYRPHPNQFVYRDKNKPIQINNLGLRAKQDWTQDKTDHRILFLGDSVTYGGSYIQQADLFSERAVANLSGYQSANAGVNGWGILNVHALIHEMDFLPADIYVSVFPEGDFYRGLMRIGGQPFWTRAPKYALEELLHYFLYKKQLTQFPPVLFYELTAQEKYHIAERAAFHLKQYDDYLKQHGKKHLIYISPSQQTALGQQGYDQLVQQALSRYDLQVTYINDRLPSLSNTQTNALYHDAIHLSEAGHAVWADIIQADLKKLIS